MRGAAFARRHAADHLGAVGDRLLGMEGALRAGEALADHLGVRVDEDRHQAASFTAVTTFCGGVGEILGRDDRQAGLAQDLLAELDIGAFEPHHQRHVQVDLARRGDDALGDHVAAHDAAEDVDQDALDVGVGEDDLERGGHPLLGGAAADIEEIGRRAAIELDDVHRRHREAGAVDHAADIAVELDVVERVLGGLESRSDLPRPRRAAPRCSGWRKSALSSKFILASSASTLARAGHDQRVDLDQRAVELGEGLVERAEQRRRTRRPACRSRPSAKAILRPWKAWKPAAGSIACLQDLLGRVVRHLLDLHAALGRGDDR